MGIDARAAEKIMSDYYYSWTKQKSAVDFPVVSTTADEFVLRDGRRIYDFISTSFQANFGHQHQPIVQRVQQQIAAMPIASPKSSFDLKEKVSSRLVELVGLGPGKIFYTLSGSESVENALKIARQMTGRKQVLARQKSYHGASLGALSVTGDWRNGPHLTFDEGTVRIPEHEADPDLSKTRSIIQSTGAENIAAIILETISGTNGMSIPHPSWFAGIEMTCRQNGIMMILDEVLVGFGRCGSAFAFQDYGLKPDMVTMSKGITGGYVPFGAVWTSEAIAKHYDDEVLACGLTNYGHPLGLAALDAVMDTLEDAEFQNHKMELEQLMADRILPLTNQPFVREVRCRGLMAAIYLNCPAPSWQKAFDAGMHLFAKDNLNILAPPYVSTKEKLSSMLDSYFDLLSKCQS